MQDPKWKFRIIKWSFSFRWYFIFLYLRINYCVIQSNSKNDNIMLLTIILYVWIRKFIIVLVDKIKESKFVYNTLLNHQFNNDWFIFRYFGFKHYEKQRMKRIQKATRMRASTLKDSQNRTQQEIRSNYKQWLPNQRTPSKHQSCQKRQTSQKIKKGT